MSALREVVGVDPSLTGCGIAWPTGETVVDTKGLAGPARVYKIEREFVEHTRDARVVVIEQPILGLGSSIALAGLVGVLEMALYRRRRPWLPLLYVHPSTVKVFATGHGNASKGDMVAAAQRRLGYGGELSDEADAMWLRAIGCALLGEPLADLPAEHTRALDGLVLPIGVEGVAV